MEAVIDGLGTTFQTLTSGGGSSATDPRFPVNGFPQEPQSYEPLVHLLNKIIDRYMPRSQLSELCFHPFRSKVKDTYGSYKGLKPDGVGIMVELSTETEGPTEVLAKKPELFWEQNRGYRRIQGLS